MNSLKMHSYMNANKRFFYSLPKIYIFQHALSLNIVSVVYYAFFIVHFVNGNLFR